MTLEGTSLIIADMLALWDCPIDDLTDSICREYVGVGHGLDDIALVDAVLNLVDAGVLREYYLLPERELYYGLSAMGGALWEAARKPDWSRYVYCAALDDATLSIESPSRDAITAMIAHNGLDAAAYPLIEKPNHHFLPYRSFAMIYEQHVVFTSIALPLSYWSTVREWLTLQHIA